MRGHAREVGPKRGCHLSCYCRDCQTFAYFLERADELLDRHGGSTIVQISHARVELSEGHEQLACVRLTPSGLMRWYASCCNTPIANTLDRANLPFVGVISSCWDPELDADARLALLGPVRARVNGPGHAAEDGSWAPVAKLPLGTILHSIRVIAGSWWRNEHQPSAFFDERGEPRVTPRALEPDELAALRAQLPNPA